MVQKTKRTRASKAPTKKVAKLHIPIGFEEAVAALLATPPPQKPSKKRRTAKARKTKK
jgi:hypothetical protein